MTTAPDPTNCEQCDAELLHRKVRLVLDTGARHVFCSDRCERRWLVARYELQHQALNRIFILCSPTSKACRIARAALFATPANDVEETGKFAGYVPRGTDKAR